MKINKNQHSTEGKTTWFKLILHGISENFHPYFQVNSIGDFQGIFSRNLGRNFETRIFSAPLFSDAFNRKTNGAF